MSDPVRHRPANRGLVRRTRWLRVVALGLVLVAWLARDSGDRLGAQEQPPPPQPPSLPPTGQPTAPPTVMTEARVLNFGIQAPQRFQFKIDPNQPAKDLLPTPPARKAPAGPVPAGRLTDVPEADWQAPLTRELPNPEALKQTAHSIAKINHLNGKSPDGFLVALRDDRTDLAGLPFAMGDDCRTTGERSRQFARAVATVRNALRSQPTPVEMAVPNPPPVMPAGPPVTPPMASAPRSIPATVPTVSSAAPPSEGPQVQAVDAPMQVLTFTTGLGQTVMAVAERVTPERFWKQYAAACAQEDQHVATTDRAQQEHVQLARVAALSQVLGPEPPALRLGLVKYLAAVSHVEATRALARLAIFTEEDEVRHAAVEALKVRRERDYTDVLLANLRYPWPAVAKRAADALVKLERADLVPQLVTALDEPDPRAPVAKEGKQEVRELVRINHHRNCLLCHAPGNTGGVAPETLTAGVPVPNQPLSSQPDGYHTTSPDIIVRIDVTYLRQDFSAFLPVADAHPWPEMQRYDFLVRTRTLTDAEAAAHRAALADDPGRPSPYRKAVLAALRELTGRDAAPTAEAWRKLLNLPSGMKPTAP